LICETESNEATPTPAPRVVRRITGNREIPNQLIEITNIEEDNEDGEVRELYEGYEVGPTDKHQFRTLVQIEGEGLEGTPYLLERHEVSIIANLFGWIDPVTGYRRYKELFYYVPRKNSKTTLAAECLMGEYDTTLAFMQKAYFIQTGACPALLP